jgi:hypothetical protein
MRQQSTTNVIKSQEPFRQKKKQNYLLKVLPCRQHAACLGTWQLRPERERRPTPLVSPFHAARVSAEINVLRTCCFSRVPLETHSPSTLQMRSFSFKF